MNNRGFPIPPNYTQPINRAQVGPQVYYEMNGVPQQVYSSPQYYQTVGAFPQQIPIQPQMVFPPQPVHFFQIDPRIQQVASPDHQLIYQPYPVTAPIELVQPQAPISMMPKVKGDPKIISKVQSMTQLQTPQLSNLQIQSIPTIQPVPTMQPIQNLQSPIQPIQPMHSIQHIQPVQQIPISSVPSQIPQGYPIAAPPQQMVMQAIPQLTPETQATPPQFIKPPITNQVIPPQPEQAIQSTPANMEAPKVAQSSYNNLLDLSQPPGIFDIIGRGKLPSVVFISQEKE